MSDWIEDERLRAVIRAIQSLSGEEKNPVSVQEYNAHRRSTDPSLPAVTTIYRLVGSWQACLAAADVPHSDNPATRRRTATEPILDALRLVAEELGGSVLSSHAYDNHRQASGRDLPSSSVIRKRFGSWEKATRAAGLAPPGRQVERRMGTSEVLAALQHATRVAGGRVTPGEYEAIMASGDDECWPSVRQVLGAFGSWDAAMTSLAVEREDELIPDELWTRDELRRIVRSVRDYLGRPFGREEYEALRDKARRPLPGWDALAHVIDDPDPPRRRR